MHNVNKRAIAARFYCNTTSPLHTTRQEYDNLVRSSHFVLGSTIRGATLKTMIEMVECPNMQALKDTENRLEISRIHSECHLACPVKCFFAYPPIAYFSFGIFRPEDIERLSVRLGIERETASVAQGSIATLEGIPSGKHFTFEILLLGECINVLPFLETSIRMCGETEGIGRYRSVGYGKFKLEKVEKTSFKNRIEPLLRDMDVMITNKTVKMVFKSPFIIGNGMEMYPSKDVELINSISRDLLESVNRISKYTTSLEITGAQFNIKPDFISRFSYENGRRENRLVATQGSSLILHFKEISDILKEELSIATLLGIGEWSEVGFGRFEVQDVRE